MNRREKTPPVTPSNPVFFVLLALAAALCIVSLFLALIISIDRADELFNALRYQQNWHQGASVYQNNWQPFRGMNFIQRIGSIPKNLYIGLIYFPNAFIVGVIFFPLLVFVVPIYEAVYLGVFQMLLLAWLPFMAGVALFICAGVLAETDKVSKIVVDREPKDKF